MRDVVPVVRAVVPTRRDRVHSSPPLRFGAWWEQPDVRTALTALLVAGAYYVGALIGLSVRFQSLPISPIWPPNTILLVALLMMQPRTWRVTLLAVFGAHLLVELPNAVPLATAIGLYFTNVGEAVLGAVLVRRFSSGAPWLGTLRRVVIYLLCAVVVAPVVTSFADAFVVVLTRWDSHYWLSWSTRCVSNIMAEVTIGPALLLTLTGGKTWLRQASRLRLAEAALLAISLLVVGVAIFGGLIPWPVTHPVVLYAMLPFLLWATIRLGMGGTSAMLLGITVLATWSAIIGRGPFSASAPSERVIALQVFLTGISATMLLLAALLRDREGTKANLRASEERYRSLV
ncbi:MAG TPA: MASE1 domain-containing protein, partial [Ktedonobacterales bacterium]|nr:MASE1 domain-containing protein [Ktedonobacterales bacterium]